MTPKEKAKELVDTFRIVLMNEDTDCGNEILCTLIAKQCALIAVDEILDSTEHLLAYKRPEKFSAEYWHEVKTEIEKL